MCIVADSVNDVSKTRIFSSHVGFTINDNGEKVFAQLIVYSANVDSIVDQNAFILPVYNPGNDINAIIPLDFSNVITFMDDIDTIFARWRPMTKEMKLGNDKYFCDNEKNNLPVHIVGDYKFSVMPSKYDFSRINTSELYVRPEAKISIDVHSNDYSFIIYKFFKRGKVTVTPFGYLCPPVNDYSMMIPTIHGHPGGNNVTRFPMMPYTDFEQKADYDHTIYVIVKDNNKTGNITRNNDKRDISLLLRKVQYDFLGRKIKMYIPNQIIPVEYKITGFTDNRNLIMYGNQYKFLHDLVVDKR